MSAAFKPNRQKALLIAYPPHAGKPPDLRQIFLIQPVNFRRDLLSRADHSLQFLLGAHRHRLALIHNHDPGADLLHLLHIMRGVYHGGALPVELLDSF